VAKVTKREQFEAVRSALDELGEDGLVAFIDHELELLAKRASGTRKPTKVQEANEVTKGKMIDVLEGMPEGMTATDIGIAVGIGVQKASQLLKQLVADGEVTRTPGKGKVKTLFTRAE